MKVKNQSCWILEVNSHGPLSMVSIEALYLFGYFWQKNNLANYFTLLESKYKGRTDVKRDVSKRGNKSIILLFVFLFVGLLKGNLLLRFSFSKHIVPKVLRHWNPCSASLLLWNCLFCPFVLKDLQMESDESRMISSWVFLCCDIYCISFLSCRENVTFVD